MTLSIRLILCYALAVPWGNPAAAWDDNYRSYNNPNFRINDFQRRDFNPLSYNYIPRIEPPSFSPHIQSFTMPDLAINMHTMKLPEIFVRDLGSDMFAYKREANHFNPNLKGYDHYQANIRFDIGGQLAPNSVMMDLGKMKFDQGSQIPKSYSRLYQDTQGNSFKIDRFNQKGDFNPSHNSFVQFYQRQEQMSRYSASVVPTVTRPKPPPMELLEGFDERWNVTSQDPVQGHQTKNYEIRIDSIKNETNLKRFVSEYSGVIKTAGSAIEFTVKSPHESDGRILSLDITLKAKGAPTANITWKPVDGVDGGKAFKMIRDNLPVPLLVGPRASFRLNDVDIAESPLKVTPEGNISPKQIGDVKDLANLMGRQDLGINVSFSPPASDSPKAGFSLMNSLRNLGYMLTGRWSEVKSMRQELGAMQNQEPGKFILATGFSDPSFMGIKDLRNALSNSKDINLPQTKIQTNAEIAPLLEFKAFTDPEGRTLSFGNPISLNERDGKLELRQALQLPSQAIPAELRGKGQAELIKASFKTVNDALAMTDGVVKIGQEKFYLDQKGDFTNVKVFDQKLQKIETASNHLETYSDRLTNKLSVTMDVTNNYLQNLHGVTGQILTAKVEMTDALMMHSNRVDAFAGETVQLRDSFNNEDYAVLQKNLSSLHDKQMSFMKQEQTLDSQVHSLGWFAEKLGALTEEVKTLLPKINFDHMLSEPLAETSLRANSEMFFKDDKTIISAKANEVLDSIAGLAEAGLIDKGTATEWAKGIIVARDRFSLAVPRMGYEFEKAIDQIKDPLGEMSYAVNRKADAMFFNRWEGLIEKDPEGMSAFATKGLWTARALKWSSIGAGMGYGLVQAPLMLVTSIGSSMAAEKALKSMGVKDTVAQFYGGLLGTYIGVKVSSPGFLGRSLNFVKGSWDKVGALVENAEWGLPGMSRSIGRLINNERGSALIPFGKSQTISAPSVNKFSAIKKLPGPELPERIVGSFDDSLIQNRKLTSDTAMFKYHGFDNRTGRQFTWLVDKKYSSEYELRRSLAIRDDWGVKITHVTQFKVPKGTWISEGRAAAQGPEYPGGGYQAVIKEIPRSWIIRTDRTFQ